ncbi:hypothetical protein [Paenibacillus mucilaginosus]|uniref:hypothetical protein n=1 Tax=Paenibacillus mucilaginosus TaxID=61624 RepID=UPI001F163212|nr:hypothetical protein [Paenibacillus mucilaginosus]MCG7217499.1 hypothetical protein [Paenibacillus mucilaginosus]
MKVHSRVSVPWKIKEPSRVKMLLCMSAVVLVMGRGVVRGLDEGRTGLLFYAHLALVLLCLAIIGIAVFRGFRKPEELLLQEGWLSIRGRRLSAGKLGRVYVHAAAGRTVGIGLLPTGKRVVPAPYMFRYADGEEEALKQLEEWSARHGVTLERKRFLRWI